MTRALSALPLFLVLSVEVATAQQRNATAQLRGLDSLWGRMYERHDTVLARQLYAEDLVFTSANGRQKTREQELADVRPQSGLVMQYFRTNPSSVTARDSVATLSGVAEWRFTWNGQQRDVRRTYEAHYRRGGPLGWRIHAVRMGDAPVAAATPESALNAQAAPRVATPLPAAELQVLDKIRKDVWLNWFAGDTAALRRVLTPELVAISPDVPHWQNLEQTLAASAGFKAGGGRLLSVDFDSTTVHRFGDVVVMFSHYRLELMHDGQRTNQRGRATEVFVRHRGNWVHTSWQLDIMP